VESDEPQEPAGYRARIQECPPSTKKIITNNFYAHDEQGDNPGQEKEGLSQIIEDTL